MIKFRSGEFVSSPYVIGQLKRLSFMAGCCLAMLSFSASARAQQKLVEKVNGDFEFVNYTFDAKEYTGVTGVSSNSAYLLVIDGSLRKGDIVASAGDMLLIPAYGQDITKLKFDAQRLNESLGSDAFTQVDGTESPLAVLTNKQKKMTFWGRYSPTRLNVAAPGSVETELVKRSVVNNPTVQNIRFSGDESVESLDEAVVKSFETALKNNDAKSVSNLLSPSAFGTFDMRNGGDAARQIMAKRILRNFNWPSLLSSGSFQATSRPNVWVLETRGSSILLGLKPLGDFTYISSVENGA